MAEFAEGLAIIGILVPLCIGIWYELIHIVILGKPSRFDVELERLVRGKKDE